MLTYGWSKDIKIWRSIPDNMPKSNEWKVLNFSNNIVELIPKSKGVYIICMDSIYHKTDNLKFSTPLYTGHANNLKKRFNDHTRGNDKNNLFHKIKNSLDFRQYNTDIKIYYAYVCIKEYNILRECEQYLINIYGPKLH